MNRPTHASLLARMSTRRLRAWPMGICLVVTSLSACAAAAPLPTAPDIASPLFAITDASQKLVISQVYGGGGNTGAPFTNDFVELFNAGAVSVNVSGMSVQYASATGTGNVNGNPVTTLGTATLLPGQYFLVRLGSGTVGSPLPTADAIGSVNMSGSAGKVALVNSATGLACNGGSTVCTASQLALIVDLVGYGTTNFFEGTGSAPVLTNGTAALRRTNGCTDSNNNASDFVALAPVPRNTSTPLAPCSALPSVASVTPPNSTTDVLITADLSVTFDRAVAVSGAWYVVTCTISGAHTAQVTGGPSTFTLNPNSDFVYGDGCTITIKAALVSDVGVATNTMALDYVWNFTTLASDPCTLPFTPAYTIQGSGASSPLAGQILSTKGVVVGDHEGPSPALRGFYLQDITGDGDPATSDAVFVFNGNNNQVAAGDIVWVKGTVAEFQDQTQVSATAVVKCGTGSVSPIDVTLPVASAAALERFEGMLVRLPQTLFVTEHFQLGQFGQVVVSSSARLPQPTNVAAPGTAALMQQALNDLNRIIVDDGSNGANPDPIVFGRGGNPLGATNTLRGGDMTTGVVGVMTYTWAGNSASGNAYRVRPTNALGGSIMFVAGNPRANAPAAVGGTLRVAAMNLLNYYNSFSGCRNGVSGASSSCRGANNATEFDRQAAKTVAAITAMNSDVLGIVEIENDGYDASSAIADLVSRLNAETAPGAYAFIDVDAAAAQLNALGTDGIKVGLIYKPAVVTPVGQTAALNSIAFVNGGDTSPRSRPALTQAFQQSNGGRVIVTVNHFKSKGSACAAPDANDGQGQCNAVRVAAAAALRDWLATDPTGTADPDILILGDLNAYAMEDPVTTLRTAGYVDLLKTRIGANAYSYVFDGQWGYLDHALASPTLSTQVTGVTEWHINADEPVVLDYNTENKSAGQLASLFAPDAFRVSDHDPVLVGLALAPPVPFGGFLSPISGGSAVNDVKTPSTVPIKFSIGGNLGLNIFAAGYPLSRQVNCTTGAPIGTPTQISGPGNTGLTYSGGTYHLNWKTEKGWAGSCHNLVLRFVDGSTHTAHFSFR